MLSARDNKILTEVGADKPMGRLMREYWVPVMRAGRLKPGAAPIRLRILGEDLVAYRTPGGEVGVMDEACPHRGASMALARNEDCGLRCIFHGWKIAPDGELLDAPTHRADMDLARLPTRAHPVRERVGLVWAYLGEGEAPPFPKLGFTDLPDDHVVVATAVVKASWLSMMEGLWDTFHAQILHNTTNRDVFRDSARGAAYFSDADREAGGLKYDYPEMVVEHTDFGFTFRQIDLAKTNVYQYVAPWFLHHVVGPREEDDQAFQGQIPIDDDHCLYVQVMFNPYGPLKPDGYAQGLLRFPDRDDFSCEMPRDGYWGQDREAMKRGENYTGIVGKGGIRIALEDIAVGESQGRPDRSREILGPTDIVVVQARRLLLDAVEAHEKGEGVFGRGADASKVRAQLISKKNAPTV
jgi:phthalate 4,5-dioxygenase oxygenase subunit